MSPSLKRLFFGNFMSCIGTGMTLALLLVYLHDIRGFTTAFGGFVLSLMAILSILLSPPTGWLIDRVGPKKVIMFGLSTETVAAILWSVVNTEREAIAVAALSSLGAVMIWPPQTVLITRLTTPETNQRAFAFNFMMVNLGVGVGGILAALIIQEGDVGSFELLYRIDALTFLAYLIAIFSLKGNFTAPTSDTFQEEEGSYRDVVRDRRFMRIFFGGLIYLIFGYASLQGGLAIYLTQSLDLSPKWIGIIYGANTLAIFLLQGRVLAVIEKRSKIASLRTVGWIWAASWVVIAMTSLFSGFTAGIILAISQVIFAFGEMIWSPTAPALTNEIAPEQIRGRYNAMMGLQWNFAGVVGPLIAGFFFAQKWDIEWITLMIIGSLVGLLFFKREKIST